MAIGIIFYVNENRSMNVDWEIHRLSCYDYVNHHDQSKNKIIGNWNWLSFIVIENARTSSQVQIIQTEIGKGKKKSNRYKSLSSNCFNTGRTPLRDSRLGGEVSSSRSKMEAQNQTGELDVYHLGHL